MVSKKFEACCIIYNVREKCETAGGLLSLQKYLISQISKETNLNIEDVYEGVHMIKKRLSYKRILLVLDDVDESNKLKMLVRKSNWFGPDNIIIITTRNKQLLKEFPVDEIYEVKSLNYKDALRLFCSNAFKREPIPNEYLELSKDFLEYAGGLPLALEVLGSSLFGKSIDEWKNALEMLKELKVSYDGLQESVQEIFKDIACFFNHEDRDHVVKMLNELGRYPLIGSSNLIDKSLLTISENNVLWMHDLVRDMCRNIVYQESPNEPGKRSRMWDHKDINHVLKKNTGIEEVQAIDFREAKDTSIYHEEKEACWGWVLSALPWEGLALLVTLREWIQRTLSSRDELVELRLPCSKIELLWRGMKIFENLKSINMDGSSNLIIAPNFNGVPNLEELVLARCSNLRKLHPSIGKLKKLKLLDLQKCPKLTSVPDKFEMESLVTLNLTYCLKVKKILEFVGNMKLLHKLLLEGTIIIELPSSIECLTGLNILILRDCKNLICLPNTICSLTSLNNIDLGRCSKFDKLPEDLGNITSLKKLDLSETAIEELPSSVEFFIGLTLLNLNFCKNCVLLPSTICSLKSLESIYLWRCSKFDKLPRDLGNITSLKELGLSRTAIKELPSSIEFLIGLTSLDLTDCKNFVLLPSTVCNLKSLEIMCLFRCPKFVNLPENFGNPKHLELLNFEGTAIEVLPSVRRLAALKILILKDCKNLVCLPSTICNLKRVQYLDLTGCSKIANLLENLGNMESLTHLLLGGTAIKELPFSTIHLKWVYIVSFKVCQLSSSSFTSMPTITSAGLIDLSDCNLSAIPSGIVRILSAIPSGIDCRTGILCDLSLRGNDFVFLPGSISQLSGLKRLYLDGCKSLRSLSNIRIPSKVDLICVNNCTSLERLPERPEPPNDFYWLSSAFYNKEFTVQCFNCFKLAYNIQNFSNMFQCVQEQFPPSENSWLLY
ncbi:disease resistance protein TAO1-like [Quercus lobata]|uniref:disease resistance protein TAO1-like n=1 Tax=Quercus lobata TaxID=97700 RepID=UPI0012493761|nr:disease resistance protein TAO1-like [Quercus lobata]